MKRIISVILMMCLMLGVCACSRNTNEISSSEETASAVDYSNITPDTLELYISVDSALGSSGENSGQIKTMSEIVEKKVNTIFGTNRDMNYEETQKNDVAKKKTVKILSNEYEMNYSKSVVYSNQNTTNSYYNRQVDYYEWDDGGKRQVSIKVLNGTDKIIFYRNTDSRDWSEGDVVYSEESLIEIASELLTAHIKRENLDSYTLEIEYPKKNDSEYELNYYRYIHGYPSFENASITIDQDKKITRYYFEQTGKFDGIEEKFTKEHIDAVANALQNKIENTINTENPKVSVSLPSLVLDKDGCLYVAIQILYEAPYSEVVYAKVG